MFKKINVLAILAILLFASSCTDEDSNYTDTDFKYGTVTDIDDNVYKTLKIGTQEWMVEDLKTTRYNDGTSIPLAVDDIEWSNLTTPCYCFYMDVASNKNIYGIIYNWYTINTGKLAPVGWHVPTDVEWTKLEDYLIAKGYNYDGTTTGNKIAKSLASTTGWSSETGTIGWSLYSGIGTIGDDLTKNNTSGFAGLPSFYRYFYGQFGSLGSDCRWWSSSQESTSNAWSRCLVFNESNMSSYNHSKKSGLSVRCVRD